MSSPSQRAQPRVKYPADVRLFYADERGAPVSGRARDLGPSGIFVEARERVAIGTAVVCEIALPSGPVRLSGLVAREQTMPRDTGRIGLGIKFIDLDAGARSEIENLIPATVRGGQLVAIHVDGLKDALRSEAALTDEGVRVTTTLPFLREGGEVKVAFMSGPSRIESRGLVHDVRLTEPGADGNPRVEMRMQFVPAPPTSAENRYEDRYLPTAFAGTIETHGDQPIDDDPDRDTSEDVTEVTAVETPSALASGALADVIARDRKLVSGLANRAATKSGRHPRGTMPRRRASDRLTFAARAARYCAVAAGCLFLMAIGAAINRFTLTRNTERLAVSALRGPATDRASVPAPAVRAPQPTPALPTPAPAPAATPAPVAVSPAPAAPTPAPPREEPAKETPATETTRAATPSAAPRDSASTPQAAAAIGIETLPVGTPGPDIGVEGDEVVATVPVKGSTEGATHYPLTSPRGLAVDLPNAEAALPLGRHAVFNDGFRFVSVRTREGGGIRVVFTYAYYTPRLVDVGIGDGAVRVRVAPPRQTR